MPRKSKGGNNRRKRRLTRKSQPIQYADPSIGQLYATVEKALGNCHFRVITIKDDPKIAALSGNLKKSSRTRIQDFVLIEPLADLENTKYKIVFKYTPNQRKILENEGRLRIVEEKKEDAKEEEFIFEGYDDNDNTQALELNENFVDFI
jgi:initiation factor 1A